MNKLTREQIEAMTTDQLNEAVAVRVMRWKKVLNDFNAGDYWDNQGNYRPTSGGFHARLDWSPSDGWAEMGEVVEVLIKNMYIVKICWVPITKDYGYGDYWDVVVGHNDGPDGVPWFRTKNLHRGVAMAAVLAVQETEQ